MQKNLRMIIVTSTLLTIITGCVHTNQKIITSTTPVKEVVSTTTPLPSPSTVNTFRVTHPEQVGNVDVVCHNCNAQFKISQKIQKMALKGDAIIDCPECHQNYLKGKK